MNGHTQRSHTKRDGRRFWVSCRYNRDSEGVAESGPRRWLKAIAGSGDAVSKWQSCSCTAVMLGSHAGRHDHTHNACSRPL